MKKIICVILVGIVLLFSFSIKATGTDEIKVYYNEQRIIFDVNPSIISGRTMVPMRAIFETFGASVIYDAQTKQITGVKGSREIILTVGNTNATVIINDVKTYYTFDAPPQIISGRTLVPLRFIGQALGAAVDWDNNTKTVSIETPRITLTKIDNFKSIARVGEQLKAGQVIPLNAAVKYQWQIATSKNGVYTNIDGADESYYIPKENDFGLQQYHGLIYLISTSKCIKFTVQLPVILNIK